MKIQAGILGGGQLGRMLIQAALDWGMECRVLDAAPDGPCSWYHGLTAGSPADENDVLRFGEGLDVLTVELENVSVPALYALERRGLAVRPSPKVMEIVQDKGWQKNFLTRHGFATAPFEFVDDDSGLKAAAARFDRAVLKWRRGGYDGKGVSFDLSGPVVAPSIVERRIDVVKEISVIAVRGLDGQTLTYPVVESYFHPTARLVEMLVSPAQLSSELESQARTWAENIARALEIVGLLAVEMFLDSDGRLWINELSPRPHNTGHHTIEACETSQFEQHWRAILGMPLGSTRQLRPAAMLNVLGVRYGPPEYVGMPQLLKIEGVKLHLYGKKIATPHRKLGHITVLADDFEQLWRRVEEARRQFSVV
jgi:5-(carboxyamino)imidazole ribonucleotide synthase